jgi:hypothetical protein
LKFPHKEPTGEDCVVPTFAVGWSCIVAAALGLAPLGEAQSQARHLSGVVRDSTGRGIDGAEVSAPSEGARTTSNAAGEFSLSLSTQGVLTILARRIGFNPGELTVNVDTLSNGKIEFILMPEAAVLPEIEVKGRLAKPAAYAGTTKYDDFFRRRRAGFGTFITREQIERINAFHAFEILRSVPGIAVTPQGGDASATRLRFARCSGPSANAEVYIDGNRQIQRDSVALPGFAYKIGGAWGSRIAVPLSQISAHEIEMIEVFRGVAEIPAELNDNACAVIMIWTRWNPTRRDTLPPL